nr:MAG TPA: hypothetical protein [Caudoviricetes sp.]
MHRDGARPAGGFWRSMRPLPYPLCARLLPRLACALNIPLFVQFVQTVQTPPVLVLRIKNYASKIVQFCASYCTLPSVCSSFQNR